MEKIKFKFWLGHTKKMTYGHDLKDVHKIIPEFTPDIIPLQLIYTNSDGKEFYKNDIIEFQANYTSKKTGWLIGFIIWDQFSWKIKVGNYLYNIEEETDEFYYKAKVIGNIHPNPELINGTINNK